MFVHLKTHTLKSESPKGDGIPRKGLGRSLNHDGGALMNGISYFIKRGSTEIPCPFCHVSIQELCDPKGASHDYAGTLTSSDFWAPEL